MSSLLQTTKLAQPDSRGLDPAIHVLLTGTGSAGNRVDARVKPAHDDLQLVPIKTQQPFPVPRTALRESGDDGFLCPRAFLTFSFAGMTNNGLIRPGLPGRNDQGGRNLPYCHHSREEALPIQREGA